MHTPETDRPDPDPFGFDAVDLTVLRRRGSYKWSHHPPDVLAAWVAEMDFPVAEPVRAALAAVVADGDLGYAPLGADGGLDAMAATWLAERFGWAVEPAAVMVVADAMKGVEAAVLACTRPGDSVVIQTPIYPPFISAVTDAGRVLVENPLRLADGRFTPDLDALEVALGREARLVLLCHPHNPTGRVFDRVELEAIAALAAKSGAVVVSDEVHAALTYQPVSFRPFATVSAEAAAFTITVTSAAKAFNVAGLKCGIVVVTAPPLRQRLLALPLRARTGYGRLGVVATMAAFTHGGEWLDAVVAYLDRNRAMLADLLADLVPGVRYRAPEATFLAWLDCGALDLGPQPGQFFLERARVALSEGSTFGSTGQGWVRLNFATSRGILTEIVERMAAAVRTR